MSDCCQRAPAGSNADRPRRVVTAAPVGGLACGAMWLLCPKCPACVAGYLALLGGVTFSIPAAATLLSGLRGALVAAVAVGAAILVWRAWRSQSQ